MYIFYRFKSYSLYHLSKVGWKLVKILDWNELSNFRNSLWTFQLRETKLRHVPSFKDEIEIHLPKYITSAAYFRKIKMILD